MEQPFNFAEARSADEQGDLEADVQSYSAVCHDADRSATESPAAYLLESAEVVLHSSQGDGLRLVNKLPLIFQKADVDFYEFCELGKYRKH